MPKRKIVNDLEEAVEELHEVPRIQENLSLQDLPVEVLQIIFRFLDPKSFLAVQRLNCERFNEATKLIRVADFSSWDDVSPNDLNLYFTSNRAKYLRKINFNYVFLVRASILEKVITKCKHLTSLFVIHCGLTFESMRRIFDQCKQLTELHWNVKTFKYLNLKEWNSFAGKISVLYLLVEREFFFNLNYTFKTDDLHQFFAKFTLCKSMCINFATHTSNRYPLKASERTTTYQYDAKIAAHVFLILYDWEEYSIFPKNPLDVIIISNCHCSGQVCSELQKNENFQLAKIGIDFSIMNHESNERPHSVAFYSPNINYVMRNLNTVIKKSENNCTFFFAKNLYGTVEPIVNFEKEADVRSQMFSDVEYFLFKCFHIKELILSNVHLLTSFNFGGMPFLKGLEVLKLSSCFLNTCEKESATSKNFEEIATHCPNLQEFAILGCKFCDKGPNDRDLNNLLQWKKLCYLSLVGVKTIQFCQFLRNLPENCPNLKSLELLKIGSSCVCSYIPNVMHVLNKSQNLIHLSMNLDSIHLKSDRFWSAVSTCKSLQCFCLIMISQARIFNKPIVDAVKQLKYLHVFHLSLKYLPPNLGNSIITAMKSNGVQYARVEIGINPNQSVYCERSHLSNT